MNNDYIFWTFSAASQSIAAFVALLFAGYTLVHMLMGGLKGVMLYHLPSIP
jgi:hypothetical protein